MTGAKPPPSVPQNAFWCSSAALMVVPHHDVRLPIPTLSCRNTLEDTLAGMLGFLEHRIEATAEGRLNPY
jgi:hypothetical protein